MESTPSTTFFEFDEDLDILQSFGSVGSVEEGCTDFSIPTLPDYPVQSFYDDEQFTPPTPLSTNNVYSPDQSMMSITPPPSLIDEPPTPQHLQTAYSSGQMIVTSPVQSTSIDAQFSPQTPNSCYYSPRKMNGSSPQTNTSIQQPVVRFPATTTSIGSYSPSLTTNSIPMQQSSIPVLQSPIPTQATSISIPQNPQFAYEPLPTSQYHTSSNPTFYVFHNNTTTTLNLGSPKEQKQKNDAKPQISGKVKKEYVTKTRRLEQENFYLRTQLTNAKSHINTIRSQLDREGMRALHAAEFVKNTTEYLGDYYGSYNRPPMSPLTASDVLVPQISSNLQIFADQGKVSSEVDKEQVVAALRLLHSALCTRNLVLFSKVDERPAHTTAQHSPQQQEHI